MPAKENLTKRIVEKSAKLSKWFVKEFPNCPYSAFNMLLRKKDIKVNGARVNKDIYVESGWTVEIYCTPQILLGLNRSVQVVYEDDNILVINKQIGMEVEGVGSATEIVNEMFNTKTLLPANRIDRNTMGLVIFAKNEQILNLLIDATKQGLIEKYYRAWVYGKPSEGHKICEAWLFKDSMKALSIISDKPKKGYVKIETEFTLLKTEGEKSLIEVKLHSGKTHQIRAHMAHLGYPLIGDGKYSTNEINKKFGQKTQQLFAFKIVFKFNKNSVLNYLNDVNIEISNPEFA